MSDAERIATMVSAYRCSGMCLDDDDFDGPDDSDIMMTALFLIAAGAEDAKGIARAALKARNITYSDQ